MSGSRVITIKDFDIRNFKIFEFINSTIAKRVLENPPLNDIRPIVGIDESLNDMRVFDMGQKLAYQNIIQWAEPLWDVTRQTRSGEKFITRGSSKPEVTGLVAAGLMSDAGRIIAGHSVKDEQIIAMLLAHFLGNGERLCLLTKDINWEKDGLRDILMNEVAPALNGLQPKRLGLLVLAKTPEKSMDNYVAEVENKLMNQQIKPGFTWEEF